MLSQRHSFIYLSAQSDGTSVTLLVRFFLKFYSSLKVESGTSQFGLKKIYIFFHLFVVPRLCTNVSVCSDEIRSLLLLC